MIERRRFDEQPVRLPPQNLEAEQAILGSVLLDREVIARVSPVVAPRDFYRERHALIYQVMCNLHERSEPVDYLTLIHDLDRADQLDAAGGAAYIAELLSVVPTPIHAELYAAMVAEAGVMRRLISAGGKMATLGYQHEHDAETVLEKAEQLLLDVSSSRATVGARPAAEILRDYLDHVEAIRSGDPSAYAIPTGFHDLDRLLHGGMKRSDLVIVAARPSFGKTALALAFAANVAMRLGAGVAIFSLEMSASQVIARIVSTESGIETDRIERGALSATEERRLGAVLGPVASAPIVIDDTSTLTPSELRSRVRRIQAEQPVDLVVVDYLQLMSTGKEGANRVHEISEITRQMKILAREQHVAVLLLSQLSRAVEQRNPKIPMLSDLRESGSIEQDADVVVFIYRDEKYNRESERRGLTDLIVAKHRNGPTGLATLLFNERTMRFLDLEEQQ